MFRALEDSLGQKHSQHSLHESGKTGGGPTGGRQPRKMTGIMGTEPGWRDILSALAGKNPKVASAPHYPGHASLMTKGTLHD